MPKNKLICIVYPPPQKNGTHFFDLFVGKGGVGYCLFFRGGGCQQTLSGGVPPPAPPKKGVFPSAVMTPRAHTVCRDLSRSIVINTTIDYVLPILVGYSCFDEVMGAKLMSIIGVIIALICAVQ